MKKVLLKFAYFFSVCLFYLFRLIPIQKKKVIATSFKGMKFGDNPLYILNAIHKLDPSIECIWLKGRTALYDVPSWIKVVSYRFDNWKTIYEIATAMVWIDSHRIKSCVKKRKGQLFIETWHGGLGIKRVEMDVPAFVNNDYVIKELETTNKYADVYISQSDHLTNIYRRAFGYTGPVYKSGYPKNDLFFNDNQELVSSVKNHFGISDKKICLYAPTFRDSFNKCIDISIYDIDFDALRIALQNKFGGEWAIMVKWHPLYARDLNSKVQLDDTIINASSYQNMQELILSADVMITDYSSCIFDAFLRDIPCFTYAKDFDEYKIERGVYYQMEELPFSYAKNNEELIKNIQGFDNNSYLQRITDFKKLTGLRETGHASEDIAEKILEFMSGKNVVWS